MLLLGTPGCDVFFGIRRGVEVERLPTAEEVTAALRDVPGVTEVDRRTTPATTSWSLFEGFIHDPPYDQFLYRAGALSGVVKVRESEDGERTLELYRLWINVPPPLEVIEDTRRLMDAVYESLRRHAPDLPPAERVVETIHPPPG